MKKETQYRVVSQHGVYRIQRKYWFGWLTCTSIGYEATSWQHLAPALVALAEYRGTAKRWVLPFKVIDEEKV